MPVTFNGLFALLERYAVASGHFTALLTLVCLLELNARVNYLRKAWALREGTISS